ncbi:hypothetical protein [Spiroplasma ixodetis]|nr:hypothetical protein [Spiroplasma ixodetis]WJG70877.1 hypothetical protein SIXOD_v1c21620 [Spiroplasma ixodetis Y32]
MDKKNSGMDKSILILLKHIEKINKKLDEILKILNAEKIIWDEGEENNE